MVVMSQQEDIKSEYLSVRELKGLKKIGDIMIPRQGDFPSFSETGCLMYVDDAVAYLDPIDLNDLKSFLRVASFLPSFIVKFVLKLLDWGFFSLLRLGNLGIRGIVFSLYYSNKTAPDYKGSKPHDLIGYHVKIVPLE